mgnify:CR=1 FL=1
MELSGVVGESEHGCPGLIQMVSYVAQEHCASDWVACALTNIVGVA